MTDRRTGLERREALKLIVFGVPSAALLASCGAGGSVTLAEIAGYTPSKHLWGYAIDTKKCIGCGACTRACRAENDVPEKVHRTWVERYRISEDGEVHVDDGTQVPGDVFLEKDGTPRKAFFVPKLCNHCEKSVCSQVCPVGASYTTEDGVVLVDHERCIGCGYCVQACPYASRFINPETHLADKCTFCYHRVTKGMPTACVQSCPREARLFGDLKDPTSRISMILSQQQFRLLRPEMGTHPKCYYLGLDREVV